MVISGSREWDGPAAYAIFEKTMDGIHADCKKPVIYISGKARTGADRMLIVWAKARGHPWAEFPADWNKYNKVTGEILRDDRGKPLVDKSAGHRRNGDMNVVCNCLVAFWDGSSPGTRGMIKIARAAGRRVLTILV